MKVIFFLVLFTIQVMNLNVRGYFLLSQHIAKKSMIPNKGGKIINIASIQGGNITVLLLYSCSYTWVDE
jgi:NAD(P)-dependent dehydrogenase (short-subunit alcohol dehydrogenase family)